MKRSVTIFLSLLVSFAFAIVHQAHAQERQSLSVTPPFSQLVVEKGDVYRSYVKITNPNPYPLTLYATPVNFATADEDGHPKFMPLIDEAGDAGTMARWFEVSKDPITLGPESSYDLYYSINVPVDAAPGGHFAALLIGTKLPETDGAPAALKTSQVVSALFLARVEGEVVEKGQIREFSIERWFSSTPRADFVLRFENDGNVYLQPQGDITIYNMWGKESGYIPVNQKTNFGNVLPGSIRKFSFSWEGTPSLTDIGRYKAIATISFGVNGKQSVDRSVYFWVIPVKATLITLGFLVFFVTFILVSVRMYVRHALQLAGHDPRAVSRTPVRTGAVRTTREINRTVIAAPLREGVLDLRRSVARRADDRRAGDGGIREFLTRYRRFFSALAVGGLGCALIFWYVLDARTEARPYEVTVKNPEGAETTLSSEEVIHDRREPERVDAVESPRTIVSIVNASGVVGAGADVAVRLEQSGYTVADISNDADARDRTAIVFNASELESATAISKLLGDAPLSARAVGEEAEPPLLIIVGRDQAN